MVLLYVIPYHQAARIQYIHVYIMKLYEDDPSSTQHNNYTAGSNTGIYNNVINTTVNERYPEENTKS